MRRCFDRGCLFRAPSPPRSILQNAESFEFLPGENMLCPIGLNGKSLERAWITRSEITGVRAATKLQMGKFGAFRCAFFGVSEFSLVESLLLRSCFSCRPYACPRTTVLRVSDPSGGPNWLVVPVLPGCSTLRRGNTQGERSDDQPPVPHTGTRSRIFILKSLTIYASKRMICSHSSAPYRIDV